MSILAGPDYKRTMADYAETTLFIKGSKKAVARFLNRGLRARKSDRRVTLRMTGGEIVELLNGLEKPLQMGSYLPRPKTFDIWDTTNKMYDLYYWYVHGCVRHFKHRWMDERVAEIEEFMEAHPSDFQKVPQEKDPLFSNPDEDEITFGFEYADRIRAVRMLHPELIPEYVKYSRGFRRAASYQKKKYGVVGWYDWNCEHYGCKWDSDFERWKLKCERDDTIVLSAEMETPWAVPFPFFDHINQAEGITVYAYGGKQFSYFCTYNGGTGEAVVKDPDEDSRYDQFKKAYEESEDYSEDWAPSEISDMINRDYLESFMTELEKEFSE